MSSTVTVNSTARFASQERPPKPIDPRALVKEIERMCSENAA